MRNVFASTPVEPGQILQDPELVSVVKCDVIPGAIVAKVKNGRKDSCYLLMGEFVSDHRYRVAQVWPMTELSRTVTGSGVYTAIAQPTDELTGAVGMLVTRYFADGNKPVDAS